MQSLNITLGLDLTAAGGESSHTAYVQRHVVQNRATAVADRLGCSFSAGDFQNEIGGQRDECVKNTSFMLTGSRRGRTGPWAGLLGVKTGLTLCVANQRMFMGV
jgi:hypothetical protein